MPFGVHEVLFEGGDQTLIHVPPSRAAAATVSIVDLTEGAESDDRIVLASSAATVDSYNVSITAAAGAGQADPRLMTHAGALATAGRAYVIETADGRHELFFAEAVSATTIRSATPLSGAYATGSTVRGVQLSCVFPSAVAADEQRFDIDAPMRVQWSYTGSDGSAWNVTELVRLVRSHASKRNLGDVEAELRRTKAELVRAMGSEAATLRNLISRVASRLTAELRATDVEPETWLAGDAGFELLFQAVVLQIAEDGFYPATRDPQQYVDDQARAYARLWSSLVRGKSSTNAAEVDRTTDMAPAGASKKVRSPWGRG